MELKSCLVSRTSSSIVREFFPSPECSLLELVAMK